MTYNVSSGTLSLNSLVVQLLYVPFVLVLYSVCTELESRNITASTVLYQLPCHNVGARYSNCLHCPSCEYLRK